MFGNFFEGQLCADSCVKFKGKVIPDCEDLGEFLWIGFKGGRHCEKFEKIENEK